MLRTMGVATSRRVSGNAIQQEEALDGEWDVITVLREDQIAPRIGAFGQFQKSVFWAHDVQGRSNFRPVWWSFIEFDWRKATAIGGAAEQRGQSSLPVHPVRKECLAGQGEYDTGLPVSHRNSIGHKRL